MLTYATQSNFRWEFFSTIADSWIKLKTEDFKCVFVVYCVIESYRSALVHELLINNTLFVGQLYKDKSLASRAFACFCCFTSQVNSYGHCGTVSSPNHTFS